MGGREITFCRYGVSGTPLLLFPTAGGDAEEPERFHLIDAIGEFLEDLRLKVYVVDSLAGQAWVKECRTLREAAAVQNRFDQCIVREVVPAIHRDCGGATAMPNSDIRFETAHSTSASAVWRGGTPGRLRG